jgi:hypothetical protein
VPEPFDVNNEFVEELTEDMTSFVAMLAMVCLFSSSSTPPKSRNQILMKN